MPSECDLAIVGGGAAGLMAGIWAGRAGRCRRIVVLDGARRLGAKILVAGGGRCNVSHDRVGAEDFNGSSHNAIRKVLGRFDVGRTIAFFEEIGVPLKREPTGKLFPASDRARTVLDALVRACRGAGAEILAARRVDAVRREGAGFTVLGTWGELSARSVILATGGRSLPKSGSDGHGLEIARSLGHSVTPRVSPGLVALTLAPDSFLRSLSGVSAAVTLSLETSSGRRLASFTDSLLATHFGISGPAALDLSRHVIDALADDPGARIVVNWLPGETIASVDLALRDLGRRSPGRFLAERLPERLARALCAEAGVDPAVQVSHLPRDARRTLARAVAAMPLRPTGSRGFSHAEVTAGGIPLAEVRLETMASRICPGLAICGEICDVDGRVGGYNFQWAWASGYVAGVSAAP